MSLPDGIEGSQKLTRILGSWPCFHDAEVVRIVLDRGGAEGPTLEMRIQVDGVLVTLLFVDVAIEELRGFNHQNALFELRIARRDPESYRVEADASYGVSGSFECRRAVVVDAIECAGA